MDKNIGTHQIFHSQPVSSTNSQESTTSEVLISGEELSQKLNNLKSVTFLNTATSTTTLSEKEPLKKLRPELSTLLTCSIKQTRSIVKATHHIQILTTVVRTTRLQESSTIFTKIANPTKIVIFIVKDIHSYSVASMNIAQCLRNVL